MIVFEDEASFRQTPTLHATWSRRGHQPQIPTRGERNTQKIFGAVRLDNAQFTYLHQEDYFAWETYLAFVDQVLLPTFYRRGHRIYLIEDNASYHKKQETYDYFAQHRRYLENASGTTPANTPPDNRFFESPTELCRTLFRTFDQVRRQPKEIEGLRAPFF